MDTLLAEHHLHKVTLIKTNNLCKFISVLASQFPVTSLITKTAALHQNQLQEDDPN